MLGLMRLFVLSIRHNRKETEISTMRKMGIALISLSFVISGIVLLTIREQQNPVRSTIIMITIATFTFGIVGWSVRNIVKAHKYKSVILITLRNISCAGAVGSILSLERGMLGSFGDASSTFAKTMEAVSGAAAFLLIVWLGIDLILLSKSLKKESQ